MSKMPEETLLQEKKDSIEVSTESMEEVVNDLKRIDDMLQERFL
jgi:hypothetical protein